ncbi:MAG TPA: SMP-30/gluconolactonase/LRE family protein [Castellaniella sp.]|nr:SMP-30/gluconolactonase/LRE family protein [Castellaniella sp.]
MNAPAEVLLHLRDQTGESPAWHPGEQALYWVDIPAGLLHRWRFADGQHTSWRAPQPLACIVRRSDGGWVGAMADGVYQLSPQNDQGLGSQRLVQAQHARSGMRFNDGRCDRQGRFWVSSMYHDTSAASPVGCLYRLSDADQGLQLDRLLDDLITPNGLAFSPDGRTMYLSDSHPSRQCVWAFDFDPTDGVPSRRRIFIERLAGGRPDGAAIDVDGCYWICGNDAGLVHRYTPTGRLDRSLQVPAAKVTMCAFGGPDMMTLFVTSIRAAQAAPDSLDGAVFTLHPGVQGIAEPALAAALPGSPA